MPCSWEWSEPLKLLHLAQSISALAEPQGRGRSVMPDFGSWAVARWEGAPKLHTVSRDAKHLSRRDKLEGDSREGPLQHHGSNTLLGDGEMEVQIPSGRKGIEHGSPTSWVTALIIRLGDKKGMTAAVVNPTSYIFEDFFSFCCKYPKQNILDETKHFPHCKMYGICLISAKKTGKNISDWSDYGFFSPFSFIP